MKRPILVLMLALANPAFAGLPEASPESVGLDPARLARLDNVIDRGKVPGAVVVVGRKGVLAFARAYGERAVVPTGEPMTRDTIFDMASLTKPVATATSMMILIERGLVRLADPISRHLPELESNGKGSITVEQLLRHRSGLIADNPVSDYADGPERAWERIAKLKPVSSPGEKFLYSDVNYIILGKLVEKLSGRPLDAFAAEEVFKPLGMVDSAFRPVATSPTDAEATRRIAPTEPEGDRMIRGVVHDPRSRALGGVAGHAGLFATADDLAIYAQMLLDGGRGRDGARILAPLSVRAMTDPGTTPPRQRRGLGWDVDTSFSTPRGSLFGPTSFGHTGFTGTSIWIDPETATFVILLTSRLHPDGKGASPIALRSEVATIVASAIMDADPAVPRPSDVVEAPADVRPAVSPVSTGIDVLIERGFAPLKGKRVGLVTNHTGRTKDGTPTIDILFKAPDVKLVALFSPEHGIRGAVDTEVGDAKDEATGLPISSLYGKTRKPTPESLREVDVLVYDIQDVGARFYTYISTLGLVLEAAKERGIPLVVLDRPNPIGGEAVAGPVREPEFAGFIAHHAMPVRHGMTVGELAKMFNAERKVGADLEVIACENWHRGDYYDRTGLTWVDPSPNMRSLDQAVLYPGVCLLEATNFATGRGTDTPFERVGAPYIDQVAFAKALNELRLPGLRFIPIRFTPKERQFAGQECGGVFIAITDRAAVEPVGLGIGLATVLRQLHRDTWKPERFRDFLAHNAAYEAVLAGKGPDAVRATWEAGLAEFLRVRSRHLIYR